MDTLKKKRRRNSITQENHLNGKDRNLKKRNIKNKTTKEQTIELQ